MNRPSQGRCESTPTFILSFFIFVPQIGSTKQIKQDRSSIQTASDNVSIDGSLISNTLSSSSESNMKERRQRDGNPILQQICYVAVLPLSRFNHPPSLLRSTLGHVSSPLPNYACLLLLSTIRTRSTVDASLRPKHRPLATKSRVIERDSLESLLLEEYRSFLPERIVSRCIKEFSRIFLSKRIIRGNRCVCARVASATLD